MFLKKNELSEEELKQKRKDLDVSLQKAEDRRKEILERKCLKLKKHSVKVNHLLKNVSKPSNNCTVEMESKYVDISQNSEFLMQIDQSDTMEKFQLFMQKPETVSSAAKMVNFLEKYCKSESCEIVKNRPKVFMSLALLANYPNDVMPNANHEENDLLSKSKNFFDSMIEFFRTDANQTVEKHSELSRCWMRTIHAFDEWFIKDKQELYEKMKTDFLTWVRTVGNLSVNDPSRSDWEPHALNYQNEILKRIQEIFGLKYIEMLSKDVEVLNELFENAKFFIKYDEKDGNHTCYWELTASVEPEQNPPESTQLEFKLFEKLKTTNIHILHELMLKENDIDFESILRLSGKSMQEVSESNRKNLEHLISILRNESDTNMVAITLKDLFYVVCSSLNELAGENEDYCQEIELADCSIDPINWVYDSCKILRWIVSMCKRCCAPVRDQTCHELEMHIDSIDNGENLINSFANSLSLLFDLINNMRSDFCNFRLRFLVAQIDGKGIAEKYELEKFMEKFPSILNSTKKWLALEVNNDNKPLEVLANSYLRLFDPNQNEITDLNAPETFYLDIERIKRYREELKLLIIRESALIYFKNHLKSLRSETVNTEEFISDIIVKANLAKTIDDLSSAFKTCAKRLVDYEQSVLQGNITRLFSFYAVEKPRNF